MFTRSLSRNKSNAMFRVPRYGHNEVTGTGEGRERVDDEYTIDGKGEGIIMVMIGKRTDGG